MKNSNILDLLCGIHRYSTDEDKYIYAELHTPNDFVVEEILADGYVLSIDNPTLKPSGYPGLFTHFVLVKRNMDTFTAMKILSRRLKIPRRYIFLSGLKDKEAITVQRGCIFGVTPEEFTRISLPSNIRIYSPIRELRRIHIGSHKGNHFRITLRNVDGDIKTIDHILRQEMLNFFGYQRFGLWKPMSHIAGKMIVQGQYRDGLEVFLIETNPLFPKRGELREYIEEGLYGNALKLLPRRGFFYEKLILRLLSKYPPNIAIRRLPRDFLRITLESYQAFLFNVMLSEYPSDIPLPDKIPVIGYSTSLTHMDPNVRAVMEKILEIEDIRPQNFKKDFLPRIIARGGLRKTTFSVENPKIYAGKESNVVIIEFSLSKGTFATIVLREITKGNILRLLLSRRIRKHDSKLYRKMLNYYTELHEKYFNGVYMKSFHP